MPEQDRSKRGGRTSGGDSRSRDENRSSRGGMSRAHSLRSMRSGSDDRGRGREEGGGSSHRRSSSQRAGVRSGSGRPMSKEEEREFGMRSGSRGGGGGGSDHKRSTQSERGARTTGKSGSVTGKSASQTTGKSGSQPLERQTSNNEDSMAMLLGLAGKKKPRKRSDSDSSSGSSSDDSSKSSKGGPPITGEKAKQKVKDGPLLRAAQQQGGSDRSLNKRKDEGLDLSGRGSQRGDDSTTYSGGAGAGAYNPTASTQGRTAGGEPPKKQAEKNDFVSRPDLRKVDQSVNLMDVEAGRADKPGSRKDAFGDASTTSFTSTGSSAYSRNSFSRNKKNPYLKVSPWENFMYAVKDFFRNLGTILCNGKCLGVFGVILLVAILLPLLLPKGGVVKESELLVPSFAGAKNNDGNTMVHPVIDTIEKEGITYLVPVFPPEEADERAEIMHKILLEHRMDFSYVDVYAEEGLRWMSEYDPAQLSLNMDEGAILQRYALAVFFFATHPGTAANRTTDEAITRSRSYQGNKDETTDAQGMVPTGEQDERRIDSYGANWMIGDNICDWQGVECQDNSRVVHLNMSGSTLQGTLPAELGLLKELSVVDLSHNYLEGPLPKVYVQRLTKLKYLMLHDNLLQGLLPEGMGVWTSLTYVNLAQNKFSGLLPSNLEELTDLELLFLQENLLSGTIPSMKGMKALEYLYLNNNDFHGVLPHDMFKDKALVDVRLEYNGFSGPLPDEVHKLHGLEVLSVGNNDFNGTIPDVFMHTKNLIALDLHKNEFSGSLPASLGQLTNLEHLLLDHNAITGTIQPEWFAMPKLRTLVLHHNNLVGEIPSTINGLSNLHDLWLNHNAFVGSLPEELGECSNLVNLYLHDNAFTGTLPSTLHELDQLGSLRVQKNQLTGAISPEVCALKATTLSYLAADCESKMECTCCDKCY